MALHVMQPRNSRKCLPSCRAWRLYAQAARHPAMLYAAIMVTATMMCQVPAYAQAGGPAMAPTPTSIPCLPEGEALVPLPELVSKGGKLEGTIRLISEQQRLQVGTRCTPPFLRAFRGVDARPEPPAKTGDYPDPLPGPTLRARVGDLVQLKLVNEVDPNDFGKNIDRVDCIHTSSAYPSNTKDAFPNCLHGSSTANIHFHGTHTNPGSTGDNVFVQVRPLPRDIPGNLAVSLKEITDSLDDFFKTCTEKLSNNPLADWPRRWSDLPAAWTDKQKELLKAYDEGTSPYRPPPQDEAHKLSPTEEQIKDGWPQYYIGAFPYCFPLPAYTANIWPPPPGASPIMGQAPGTHWYHAHKHGSTAINVANGMTGAFIIEGASYDDALDAFYGQFIMENGEPWSARSQPILVLNQLGDLPSLMGGQSSGDFFVNGRLRPKLRMQPGSVQLWRIVNTSGRSAVYFMRPSGAPDGLEWKQIAQDGVQFSDANYRPDGHIEKNKNRPFLLASGNRADLLVKAPLKEGFYEVRIQNVIALSRVVPNPQRPTVLMTVEVTGTPMEMPFIPRAPRQPLFLTDITDNEVKGNPSRVLEFNSKAANPAQEAQHTINDVQFVDGHVNIHVMLSAAEEWTIKNRTTRPPGPGNIDHPFHIHINPFQVTEVFDPNERLLNEETGELLLVNDKTVPKYVTDEKTITIPERQCFLNPAKPDTWKPCHGEKPPNIWWDVFRIPSGRPVPTAGDPNNVIPGYFKMRSRFVDYPGLYVLHCHILTHEDRGMMFIVEVMRPRPIPVRHH
jgi:FtsP/CotA-like multicopper oxidase with cupredoxin domain